MVPSRRKNYHVDKITAVFGFQRLFYLSVYRVLENFIIFFMNLTVLLELKAALNSRTTLSIWKPKTLIWFFWQHVRNIAQLNRSNKSFMNFLTFPLYIQPMQALACSSKLCRTLIQFKCFYNIVSWFEHAIGRLRMD